MKDPTLFFLEPSLASQKQYEALRMYYVDGVTAKQVAKEFGYTHRAMTSLVTSFRKKYAEDPDGSFFFVENNRGRKVGSSTQEAKEAIVSLRKKYHSVAEIKVAIDAMGFNVSERNIYNILKAEGFGRLPRRSRLARSQVEEIQLTAEKSRLLTFESESFKSSNAGILLFLPLLRLYQIDTLIEQSLYPSTNQISKTASILSFLALKLSNRRRYSSDDTWCMDRGLGLFAGLNVLPKTAWFTSYSDRVTSKMNLNFLKQLHKIWLKYNLLDDTANLDFTTIPYWGDGDHLENNWSGKRGKVLRSMLAVLAHDPDTGIVDYGHSHVMHKDESNVVLEFIDFYYDKRKTGNYPLEYLVFDSKFTSYENLSKLNDQGIKFITIRRRGKQMLDHIDSLPQRGWKQIRVDSAGHAKRSLRVYDSTAQLRGYGEAIRQIIITGNGKIKPAVVITNDFDLPAERIIRKYAQRWSVEKNISTQIDFFHLNLVSSSMVIKVDFDLTMSILAHNLYRLLALEFERYSHLSVQSLYDKFVNNAADIEIDKKEIVVKYKKKRNLPLILETTQDMPKVTYPWLGKRSISFEGASYS